MDETQKQLIQEQMQNIPPEVRKAIENSDWERIVFNIGRENKLHMDDIDVLSIETILTMIGLEHPKDFSINVQKRIGISDSILEKIVEEINAKLFSKIREVLKTKNEQESADNIMSDDEKDELHNAGISVDENYTPKKKIETPPSPKPIVAPRENTQTLPNKDLNNQIPKSLTQNKETQLKIPEINFDPYRETIE